MKTLLSILPLLFLFSGCTTTEYFSSDNMTAAQFVETELEPGSRIKFPSPWFASTNPLKNQRVTLPRPNFYEWTYQGKDGTPQSFYVITDRPVFDSGFGIADWVTVLELPKTKRQDSISEETKNLPFMELIRLYHNKQASPVELGKGDYSETVVIIWSPEAINELETLVDQKSPFTAQELIHIKTRQIFIGMSKLAMYASWGNPSSENRTVNAYGESIQHIYGTGYKHTYVYTDNGEITSWQD